MFHEVVGSSSVPSKSHMTVTVVFHFIDHHVVGLAFHILYTKFRGKGRTFFEKERHGDENEDEDGRHSRDPDSLLKKHGKAKPGPEGFPPGVFFFGSNPPS